jgi:hypothetical protein
MGAAVSCLTCGCLTACCACECATEICAIVTAILCCKCCRSNNEEGNHKKSGEVEMKDNNGKSLPQGQNVDNNISKPPEYVYVEDEVVYRYGSNEAHQTGGKVMCST